MPLARRQFLHAMSAAAAAAVMRPTPVRGAQPNKSSSSATRVVHTVTGPATREQIGLTLAHEHVLVDFVGAAAIKPGRYDPNLVFEKVLPYVQEAATAGVQTIVECTPNFLGRDPLLLRKLSLAAKVRFVTNTGLYGARDGIFLPPFVQEASAAQLARRWIREAKDGIDQTGIRPGFIKSGVNATERLSAVDRKLVEAAARTHQETRLAIAVHTGRGPGLEQLAVLREHGVPARAFIWVHAASALDDALFAAADAGAWLSFDSVRPNTLTRHVQLCAAMKRRGHLGQVLISHDAGWYDPAKPGGGVIRPYTFIFETFLPALRQHGFSTEDVDQLLRINPYEALAAGQ